MSVDPHKDEALDAIAQLSEAAVKGDVGEPFLKALYKDPRDILRVNVAREFPALAVYVSSEKKKRYSSSRLVNQMMVTFDYVAPSTNTNKREQNWPPLRHVWHAICSALDDGHYPSVADDAMTLCAAGLEVKEETAEVIRYAFLGDQSYPWFRAQVMVEHTPADVDFNTLDDYLRHFTGYTKPGGEEYDPAIDDTTNLLGTQRLAGAITTSSFLSGTLS